MKLWMWIALAIVVGLPLLAFVVGSMVPRDHVAKVAIDLASPPDRVWAIVSDFAKTTEWRSDVKSVTMQPTQPVRFTEQSSQGDVTFELVSQDPPRRQVVRVVDDNQPFGGTWTWDLTPAGAGTSLTITEAGFVKNAIFRAMGLIFFSPYSTLETYLRSLARTLGETSEPRRVD
jgi:uncharacterized protein YndB with AHSA1/START domain